MFSRNILLQNCLFISVDIRSGVPRFCLAKLQPTSQKRHLIESEQEPGSRMVRVRRSASDNDCPICMDPAKFAVETNCGHMYCCK
nr:E3 ubiquitin-protein ligase RNF170-like isoform X5 [Penaeus vannamei]